VKNFHLTFCTALLAGILGSTGAHAQGTNLSIAAAGNDLGTLDPHRATATPDIGVVSMIFNGLVRITPGKPVPGLLGLLVPYHGGNIVCKAAAEQAGDGFARKPVGTGPFEFVDYQPQQFVKLKANEAYFRGSPQIKEITV
jgi:ABC-type transport system substrate-binding protein